MMTNLHVENLKISFCSESDIARIADCARRIWTRYYPSIIGMEQVIYMLNRMYNLSELEKQYNSNFIFLKITSSFSKICGFAVVEKIPNSILFLHKFYIDLYLRGSGASHKLMEAINEIAHLNKLNTIQLNVNRNNIPAIQFYLKNGFQILYSLNQDIGGGFFMRDYRMEKTF